MKKNRSIKKLIKKRIEISNNQKIELPKNQQKSTPKIVKKKNPKPISTPTIKINDPRKKINDAKVNKKIPENLSNKQIKIFERSGVDPLKNKRPVYFNYPPYVKKKNVDFDLAICISSYNRYSKVKKLLEQIYSQDSEYTYKVFFMNDGSSGTIYGRLKNLFPNMEYIENKTNGGKINYWRTVTNLWKKVKVYNTHALCQIDDDFILSKNFINHLMDKFFEIKNINNTYLAFQYHNYNFSDSKSKNGITKEQSLDGGVLYDIFFMELVEYSVGQTKVLSEADSSRVWVNVSDKLRIHGGMVYRFSESLAYHNGNEDSKLNPKVREKRKMITKDFKND